MTEAASGVAACHGRPGGPPLGSDPQVLAAQFQEAGFRPERWEPASGSVASRGRMIDRE
ncbi:MAG: hypothetical protein VKM17_11595 [Cyanobacteriota bacterium]|nr:hypothetical protein [Cyanobacteriota bacterium]